MFGKTPLQRLFLGLAMLSSLPLLSAFRWPRQTRDSAERVRITGKFRGENISAKVPGHALNPLAGEGRGRGA
jgi:hypothetical protein